MFQSAATLPVGPTPACGGTRAPASLAADAGTASRQEQVLADRTASSASLLSKSVSLEMLAARCRAAAAAAGDRIPGHAARQWLRAASPAEAEAAADRLRWRGGSPPPTSASVAATSGAGKTAGR